MPLPLTILKHAIMKIDSFQCDIREISEEEDLEEDTRGMLDRISDMAGSMETALIKLIATDDETEDSFMREEVKMDELDPYPDSHIETLEDLRIDE